MREVDVLFARKGRHDVTGKELDSPGHHMRAQA